MTKKHGTASQVTGRYVEFQAAVLRALPRDIDPDLVLEWAKNVEELTRVLREVLMPDSEPLKTYPLSVDYGKSVEAGVRAGNCHFSPREINSRKFPTKRKGTAVVEMGLIQLGRDVTTDRALLELHKMGYRPTELRELLAFVEKYPEVNVLTIVALGSFVWDRDGNRYVPTVHFLGKHLLRLSEAEGVWPEDCHFAAVRK